MVDGRHERSPVSGFRVDTDQAHDGAEVDHAIDPNPDRFHMITSIRADVRRAPRAGHATPE
jgi:hypothetical protein